MSIKTLISEVLHAVRAETVMAADDDRPLAIQTAAPPTSPPRRPIVGLAMADADDLLRRLVVVRQDIGRQFPVR